MVEVVRQADEFPTYAVGLWTLDKLYILCSYVAQVTHAMKGNSAFSSLCYVDLFAGSGVCTTPSGSRYPGSALLAAGCTKPFDKLVLVEKETTNAAALEMRLTRVGYQGDVCVLIGDTNKLAQVIAGNIPTQSLTIAFVDPFSLNVHYDAIQIIAQQRSLDLVILFADSIDLVRNVESYYYPNPSSKLDFFLGPNSNWRHRWDALDVRDAEHVRGLFASIYLEQLARIGYGYSDMTTIDNGGRPLYRLVYASKNKLGLKFWHIAKSERFGGDRNLFSIP